MATSTYPAQGGVSNTTTLANFIPEIWSNEVKAAYMCRLVVAGLVKNMSMVGKKGDTIHIPAPSRGSVTAKASGTAVTIQNDTAGEVQVAIDKHYEYSRLVEDIAAMQALASQRSFYVEDAGYALAKQIDTDLHNVGKYFGDASNNWVGSSSWYCDASTGLTAYATDTVAAADVFTDACFRDLIQKQDDLDVPYDNRAFVIPPSLKNAIMGVDRYVSSDFVSGRAVENAKVGELYGIPIYVSTNCPVVEAAGDNSANSGDIKQAMLIHRDTMILAMQQNVRSQTQYKQEWLANLVTSDAVYGVKAYQNTGGFNMIVNA